MKHTYSAGGVILNAKGQVLLIDEGGGFWGLPKGRQENGESLIETAMREIKEESGVEKAMLLGGLGSYERQPYNFGKGSAEELKHITLFLFMTDGTANSVTNVENNATRWLELDKAAKLLTHPKDRAFFQSKLALIQKYVPAKL